MSLWHVRSSLNIHVVLLRAIFKQYVVSFAYLFFFNKTINICVFLCHIITGAYSVVPTFNIKLRKFVWNKGIKRWMKMVTVWNEDLKHPQPYFQPIYPTSTSASAVQWLLRVLLEVHCCEVKRQRWRKGERAKHGLAFLHFRSAGQQLPKEKGYIISLHLRPWTCHGPKTDWVCPWDPTSTHHDHRRRSLQMEKRGEGQGSAGTVAWEAIRAQEKEILKDLRWNL